ncbi:hypothetical protein SYNTR_1692 [Candidatus Syntrophocurvum alkaliphilum]|uniref:Uncharacterized protein n=1 Tax=Candidatus Syntrophocurvum alkaliphilum TaxID=2293317 RepID=A0A6I6DJT8_9FIRM|nr:hypothetical protein [Candidatus Syntrophocurvum alkaliphilum]QGU00286.1 hypothetical protein SYNTR_1692 [Candidatus Syntrophocurvum alkaliphilum]
MAERSDHLSNCFVELNIQLSKYSQITAKSQNSHNNKKISHDGRKASIIYMQTAYKKWQNFIYKKWK